MKLFPHSSLVDHFLLDVFVHNNMSQTFIFVLRNSIFLKIFWNFSKRL